jgi:hypothetical protein
LWRDEAEPPCICLEGSIRWFLNDSFYFIFQEQSINISRNAALPEGFGLVARHEERAFLSTSGNGLPPMLLGIIRSLP